MRLEANLRVLQEAKENSPRALLSALTEAVIASYFLIEDLQVSSLNSITEPTMSSSIFFFNSLITFLPSESTSHPLEVNQSFNCDTELGLSTLVISFICSNNSDVTFSLMLIALVASSTSIKAPLSLIASDSQYSFQMQSGTG